MSIKTSIVVPTYNEKDNLLQLVDWIQSILNGNTGFEIIVVDDNSPDGTGQLAEKLSMNNKSVKVIHRPKKLGLASALIEGFKVSKGEYIVVSDADLQHSPVLIKTFLDAANKGADLVIASRYVKGASISEWSSLRRVISRGATLLAHILLPDARRVKDPLSGYFMFKRNGIVETQLTGMSWKILLEILVKGRFKRFVEVPYVFRARTNGKSKLKPRVYLDYLVLLLLLR